MLVFSQTADNFFSAVNFNNIILQMAGMTLLAYGVVFVLLIGEIDLSIAYVSGVAGRRRRQLQLPGSGHEYPGLIAIVAAILAGIAIGAFQGSIIALIGVPSFVVTLAGLRDLAGRDPEVDTAGRDRDPERDGQQRLAVLLLGHRAAGSSAAVVSVVYVGAHALGRPAEPPSRCPDP